MCGIFGIVNGANVAEDMLGGLARLQYRGYDSAGLAVVENGRIVRYRAAGKLDQLESIVRGEPVQGRTAIGHTRWATHGAPTAANAHPHATERVAVVHNGIIENHRELRSELVDKGHEFSSDTDTEVIVHLVTELLEQGLAPREAVMAAATRLKGAYALAFVFREMDNAVLATRRGSPLACAAVDGGARLSSDPAALAGFADAAFMLEDGDVGMLSEEGIVIWNEAGNEVTRLPMQIIEQGVEAGKEGYDHFTRKEIAEQPTIVRRLLAELTNGTRIRLPDMGFDPESVSRVEIIACGTSRYAGQVASDWIERIAGIPASVHIASEYRYRPRPAVPGALRVFVSQSGETADTLAALQSSTDSVANVAIVNVEHSALARGANAILPTLAGPEVGVASTKAFVAQLIVLASLSVWLARGKGRLTHLEEARLVTGLRRLPTSIEKALELEPEIDRLAQTVLEQGRAFFIGRGPGHGLAEEGALKLKELSYLQAEAFAAGELKHGPISLIEQGTPVIVCAPPSDVLDKTQSNADEVMARGASVVWCGTGRGETDEGEQELRVADDGVWTPVTCAIPLQLLAYHVALKAGHDVDRPRNLAKSVTVE